MLFAKRKSRVLANDLAAKYSGTIQTCNVTFGAFTTCHYKVKFAYKNMRVEAYPFFPYCHIWIQNFSLEQDINFSIGRALQALGLNVPLHNFFSKENIPIFSHQAYDLETTKLFCRKIENEMDIVGLHLRKGEYLCISSGQIVLQNKTNTLGDLVKRIDILSNLFNRNAKT